MIPVVAAFLAAGLPLRTLVATGGRGDLLRSHRRAAVPRRGSGGVRPLDVARRRRHADASAVVEFSRSPTRNHGPRRGCRRGVPPRPLVAAWVLRGSARGPQVVATTLSGRAPSFLRVEQVRVVQLLRDGHRLARDRPRARPDPDTLAAPKETGRSA
jgi:hypothetical protein